MPTLLILVASLLGLSVLPRGLPSGNSSPKVTPAKSERKAGSDQPPSEPPPSRNPSHNPDLAILRPLIDLTDDGSGARIDERDDRPTFDAKGRETLVRELIARVHQQGGAVQAMIATLPDPDRTSVSEEYDSQLDGLQRAAETAGFVLARFRFPWDETDQSEKPPRPKIESASPARNDPANKTRWVPKSDDQPGLLVFRKPYNDGNRQTVLLVFLVLETPTRGLKKPQLVWSLDLLDEFADAGGPSDRDAAPRSFRILGPTYTGTQTSLNQAIDGWLTTSPSARLDNGRHSAPVFRKSYRFSIVASASEIDGRLLKDLRKVAFHVASVKFPWPMAAVLSPKPVTVEFRSPMNRRGDATEALMTFLAEQLGRNCKAAMLVESNTLFGVRSVFGVKPELRKNWINNVYHYPLHIANLRASYERQGLLRDPAAKVFRSAGSLELPPEEGQQTLDVIGSKTPEFSTRVDDLVMVQMMTDIQRALSMGRFDAVGITGTSSRDIIFLAQLIHEYCSDAVIFTSATDLLFTEPQTISDLRGMLVGSTYPLYAPNRLWSSPYGKGPDVFFNQDSVQANYNGMMGLLSEIFSDDPEIKNAALPLEFSQPFQAPALPPRPPIWIGVVGNRGIYPIRVVDDLDPTAEGKPDPWYDLPGAHIPLLQPSYHTFWKVLEWLLVAFGSAMFGLAWLELWWVLARINRWDLSRWLVWRMVLKRLATFLVWSREATDDVSCEGRGPGAFLVLAHVAFFLVYLTVNWPFLFPPPLPFEGVGEMGYNLANVGFVIAVASLAISLFSWFLLAVENRATLRIAAITAAVIATFLAVFALEWKQVGHSPTENYLALERLVVVTSGVSPTFPMLFVGIGMASCLVAQLKRRYFNELFSTRRSPTEPTTDGNSLTVVETNINDLGKVFEDPMRVFGLAGLVPTICLLIYLATFGIFGLSTALMRRSADGPIFHGVFWAFFTLLFVLLAFQVYLVFVVWGNLKEILGQVSRLPLTRSFYRMPTRVARWFFEAPSPRNRSEMVKRQAIALAARLRDERLTLGLKRLCPDPGLSPADWNDLSEDGLILIDEPLIQDPADERGGWKSLKPVLDRIRTFLKDVRGFLRLGSSEPIPPSSDEARTAEEARIREDESRAEEARSARASQASKANNALKKLLNRFWEGAPLAWTFAEGKAAENVQERAAEGWPISPNRSNAAADDAKDGDDDIRAAVREWIEMAEDLITLQLLRQLSQFLTQIRVMVGFIVIGSFTLLFAINSYPFPLKNRIEFFLVVLIGVGGLAILRLILGVNRDETISKVANTVPGLKLNGNLFSSLAGYILPLIGILAAFSYDLSDLLSAWLDPVFRILM